VKISEELKRELEIIRQGTDEIIPEDELIAKLENSHKKRAPLRVKLGIDPSSPDIHLGHTIPIRKLEQFQKLGHQVVLIIGGFTARIGDPTGMSETRKQLSKEEVKKNAKTYLSQVFKILNKEKTEIVDNADWFENMKFSDLISNLASKYTVARMLERDDFLNRYKNGKPIFIHEFLYALAQGYDSVVVKSDIEIGGTDQKFNCLVARDIQREYGMEPQIVITLPLLEGTDGVKKMSKSLGNYIGISESPKEIYGKTMSISDELMYKYFLLTLGYEEKTVNDLKEKVQSEKLHPRDLKARLAFELVSLYHSTQEAKKAEEEFLRVFRDKSLPEEQPEVIINTEEDSISIIKLLTNLDRVSSNSEARRLIQSGAVYINNDRISNINLSLPKGNYLVKVGKRNFYKVSVKGR
jgi:tyrosyl-tRNA synthetase